MKFVTIACLTNSMKEAEGDVHSFFLAIHIRFQALEMSITFRVLVLTVVHTEIHLFSQVFNEKKTTFANIILELRYYE